MKGRFEFGETLRSLVEDIEYNDDEFAALRNIRFHRPNCLEQADFEARLKIMSQRLAMTLNWRESIVDLLKLLNLDSSLGARKCLARELGVAAGPHGSFEQNVALRNTVLKHLAGNEGRVPRKVRKVMYRR
ncbi:hypothetical protein K469DRAFT_83908 [Zopfia rhizophila CBS 207.26]|uniref:DUF3597 domain-containing protein n=1 Tax=Zopfia rhizophila CBS 207.26 TaxID=1314779 RepID=A0A6A6EDJ0_9PEZI|nr:hypothetical protein K469DRAFT_83908 [Zopfia rhizophila CBS 207.26]